MISNINLLIRIALGALVLWTITTVPVSLSTKSSVLVYYDLISFMLVFVAFGDPYGKQCSEGIESAKMRLFY